MRELIYLLTFVIFSNFAFAAIQINEIMANPSCSESYCEYIELYNNGTDTVNMSSWKINDSNGEDSFESFNGNDILIPGNSFALIVDSDSRVYSNFETGNATWVYVSDSAIAGSGLSNSGEDINLKDENGNVIDSVSYSSSVDGKSYSLINGAWVNTEPSPGKDNIENISFSPDYSAISISEFLPDPEGDDDAAMPNGEWIELYNSGDVDLDLLGFGFKDNVGDDYDVMIVDSTTESGTVIKSRDYLVVYMNGVSGFLNNDGYEKIKLYDINSDSIDEVTYEGSDEGVSWSLSEDKWQKTTPTLSSNNMDNKTSLKSELRIEGIYDLGDGKAEWGDVIRVKFFAYKGNTGKETVWIWIEDSEGNRVTKKSKFSVYDKFQNYTFTYPIGIPDNCDDDFADGNGKVKLEGLDANDEEILEIREKPLCKDAKVRAARAKEFEYELVEFPETISDNDEFNVKVMLKNNKEDLKVDVWSYVFSGKKQYSNDNKEVVELKQGEEKTVDLKLNVNDVSKAASPKLAVKILKDGRKTPYSITKEVKVDNDKSKSESVKKGSQGFQDVTGNVVYEGKSTEAGRMGIFFFSGLMTVLGLYGFFRGWRTWR
ncbi:lamin tail domain-containing protein [Candidatus Woesearchaeota archaeon]|nr:lamin tail domain-containing protein [Candidatus Woesearchaeota archaeon]